MAEETIGIKITTDAAQATADVQKLDKAFTETDNSVKSLRTQMKEAQAAVGLMADKFGATSKEAINAAKHAADLKDRIGDAKALTDAFNPDAKFKAVASSLAGVAGGFSALQGAMALFGTENKDVEKALLKVNAAMALSQGLQAVGESIDSFRQLGAVIKSTTTFQELNSAATKTAAAVQRAFGISVETTSTGFKVLKGAIVATGIGALVVILGEVINNFDAISDWIKKSPLGALAKGVGELVTQFTDFIGVTSEAERNLDKLSIANKRANEDIQNRIKVLKAQGGSEKEIYDLGQQRVENELSTLRESLKTKGKLTDEENKQFRDLKTEQLILTADYNKKTADANKKAAEDAKKKQDETNKKITEDTKKANDLLLQMQNEKANAELKTEDEKNLALLAQQEKQKLAEVELLEIKENLKGELKAAIIADFDAKEAELRTKQAEEKAKKDEESIKAEKDFNLKVAEIKASAIKDDNERAEAQRLAKLAKDILDLEADKEYIKKSETEKAAIKKDLIDASELEGQNSKNEIVKKGLEEELNILQAQQKTLTEGTELYTKNALKIEEDAYKLKILSAKGNTKLIQAINIEHEATLREINLKSYVAKKEIEIAKYELAAKIGSLMQQIAGKNKSLAIAGLVIERAAAVAQIWANNAIANAKAVATFWITGGLPWTAINTATAIISTASVVASTIKSIQEINSAGGDPVPIPSFGDSGVPPGAGAGGGASPGAGGGAIPDLGGGGGGGGAAPDLGGGGGSTGGGGGGGNNAIRAYVVESDISGSQKRVQQIQDQARFE